MSEINEITASDMGKKGGTITRERYGSGYYSVIGKKGNNTIKRRLRLGRICDQYGIDEEKLLKLIKQY